GIGFAVMCGAAACNLGYSGFFAPALPWTVLPVMGYTVGMALAMPSITLIALDLFPQNRGMTSSLLGFQHSFFTAVTAGVISPLLSHTALTLASGMAGLLASGWLSWRAYLQMETKASSHARA
ncbi:MAG: Bcr/CflA family drug resistance efflux transporter, partial [Burkholderiales bacterium]